MINCPMSLPSFTNLYSKGISRELGVYLQISIMFSLMVSFIYHCRYQNIIITTGKSLFNIYMSKSIFIPFLGPAHTPFYVHAQI